MYTLVPLDTHTLGTPQAFIPPVTLCSEAPIPMAAGAGNYQVTGCNFPSAPKSMQATLSKAVLSDDNVGVEPVGSATTDGQVFSFSEPLPNGNYTLTWVATL